MNLISSPYGDGMDPEEYELCIQDAMEFFNISREEAASKMRGSQLFKEHLDKGESLDFIYDNTDAVIWDLLTVKATVSSGIKERYREKVVKNILNKYGTHNLSFVMDYGCGIGREALVAVNEGYYVDGVDRGQTIKFADFYINKQAAFPNNWKAIKSSDFIPISYDIIMCFEYFEHENDPEELVTKFRNILTDDGLLICNSRSFNAHDTGHLEHNFKYQYEFEKIIAAAGFECIYFPYNPPNLYNIAVWKKVDKANSYYNGFTTEKGEW